jgi:hypothetical protein
LLPLSFFQPQSRLTRISKPPDSQEFGWQMFPRPNYYESGYNTLDVAHGVALHPRVAVFRSFSPPDLRATVLIVRSVTIRKSSRATPGLIRNNPAIWPNIAQKIA